MSLTRCFFRLVLAAAGAAALLSSGAAWAAQVFSKIIVFGDSSVDSGFYRALQNPGGNTTYNAYWAAAVTNGAGVPTSGPGLVYPQVLASYYGLTANPANQPGGSNYATSGAKDADANTSVNGGFKAAIPTVTQIANYLATNPADASALYLIHSGGNDISFASGAAGSGPFPSDPTAYITGSANSLATAIRRLKTAGARTIVVASQAESFGLDALQRQLKASHNLALFASLANQGVTVIKADINAIRLAISNNPAQYGFTSTGTAIGSTACTVPSGITTAWGLLCSSNANAPATFSSPNADMTHLFADDQHLATAGQRIVADYIYALLPSAAPASRLPGSANLTGLWWNPAESGWGINFNHQGNILYATVFAYAPSGNASWLVMSGGALQADGSSFRGDLYQTTGPAFNANPFTPIGAANVTKVGSMSVLFSSPSAATLTYSWNGTTVAKAIQPQVFGSRLATCQPTQTSRDALANYQDLWWNPAESGWGVNITQQDNTLFATLFDYDASGAAKWWVMSAGIRQADGSYLGDLLQTTGSAFNAQPFIPLTAANIAKVGTMQFRFSDGTHGTLSYSVNGAAVSKTIIRQEFSTPVPACVN